MTLGQEKIPESLPLLPLKDIVVFPQMIIPVFVAEDICLRAVDAACARDRMIFLSAFRSDNRLEDAPELKSTIPPPFDVYDMGTVALVMRMRRLPDGRTKVLVQGMSRAQAKRLRQSEPWPVVEIKAIAEGGGANPDGGAEKLFRTDGEALQKNVHELVEKYVALGKGFSPDILMLLDDVRCPGRMADVVASNLGLKIAEGQRILATLDPLERLHRVHTILKRELESHTTQASHNPKTARDEAFKQQREMFLREQLKAIRSELGDLDVKDDVEELREKVARAQLPPEPHSEALKQLRRLERMNQDSTEAAITRTWVEWLADMPWNRTTETPIDLQGCKKVLDEDHFGLEKVKDRIVEYLAVKKLNPTAKGPILCFVGPPGVGKTSLGKSIARALGRKFSRISLGGVRDEAEIRGHRRTYVGAQPGRLIQAIKTAGVKNPILMLDEIDKLGADYKGDPAAALLEVLDPEQNHTFSDHYISVPFDLSQCIFLANANRLDTIPPALRDRLEVIEVPGYTEDEKGEIARHHIIPKTLQQNGLTPEILQFQDASVQMVIASYTRESGLRNLERHINAITRKIARTFAEGDEKGRERKMVKVTPRLARELLGEEKYLGDDHNTSESRVGVATGLAYTSTGGEILEVEVNLVPGKGHIALTGQLGDVMKESAQAALSFLRSRTQSFGIDPALFSSHDLHVHVPAGAIPKDGPSAGVAIAVAMLSAFRNDAIRQDVAMTGEITLHGRILPVGGLREKILAAARVGIRVVCIPEKNKGSIQEIPTQIRKKIEIKPISSLEQVLQECLGAELPMSVGNSGNTDLGMTVVEGAASAAMGYGDDAQ